MSPTTNPYLQGIQQELQDTPDNWNLHLIYADILEDNNRSNEANFHRSIGIKRGEQLKAAEFSCLTGTSYSTLFQTSKRIYRETIRSVSDPSIDHRINNLTWFVHPRGCWGKNIAWTNELFLLDDQICISWSRCLFNLDQERIFRVIGSRMVDLYQKVLLERNCKNIRLIDIQTSNHIYISWEQNGVQAVDRWRIR